MAFIKMAFIKEQCPDEDPHHCWACPKGAKSGPLMHTVVALGNGQSQVIFLCLVHDVGWQAKRKAQAEKKASEYVEVLDESRSLHKRRA